jgi:APA family basic amino acid/polyamine antiporter
MGIWSRKSVATLVEEAYGTSGPRLKRSLGVMSLTAFGVGSTVGAGIFSMTGDVAAHQAGPAVTLSFIIASVACFFAGLCYAEFAAMVPVSGSAYSYSYATLGEGVAWTIGWSLMLEWLFAASVVAISWSGYVQAALKDIGIIVPAALSSAPMLQDSAQHWVSSGSLFNLPAALIMLVCTGVCIYGLKASTTINNVIVAAKVLALIAIVFVGWQHVHAANWHPFVPPNRGTSGDFGWTGVFQGAGTLFFAYIGFDGVSTLAEETKNPQRTLPLALFLSLLVCTVLYVSVSLTITGLTDYRTLGVDDPLYQALSASSVSLDWLKLVVGLVAILGLVSVVIASIIGQVRIFYSMARDGLLPAAFGRIHPKTNTPIVATLVTGVVAAVTAALLPLQLLGDLISMGTLLAFAMVCTGIMILRRIAPDQPRPFRTPWVPFVPLMGIAICVFLMYSLPLQTKIQLPIWLAIGYAVYFCYGRRHSKLRDR